MKLKLKIKRKYIRIALAALLILVSGSYFVLVWDDLVPVIGAFARLRRAELFFVGISEPRDSILRRFAEKLYTANDPCVKNVRFEALLADFCFRRDQRLQYRLARRKKIKRKHILEMKDREYQEALDFLVDTELYIAKFDKDKYCQEGLGRLTSPPGTHDYSYAAVEELFRKHRFVDRRRALSGIFFKIVGDEKDHTRRHELVLDFLAQGVLHGLEQPLNREKALVYDPIVLLDLHNMRCGNINRIACDLFSSVGYKTRVVQLFNHVISEIYYDSSWHYFDADTVLNANGIVKIVGKIPDTKTLSENPHLWDKKDFYFDSVFRSHSRSLGGAFAYQCHIFRFPPGKYPAYYIKTATPVEEFSVEYGWNYYIMKKADDITCSPAGPILYRPSAPFLEKLSVQGGKITISCRSKNYNNDLQGYKLFVSKKSRGWEYLFHFCDEAVKPYIHPISVFTAAHYKSMGEPLPSEILQLKSADGHFSFDLPPGIYYITCKAYGRHGGEDSWTLPSNEIQVRIGQ